jgi:hypothetical protein
VAQPTLVPSPEFEGRTLTIAKLGFSLSALSADWPWLVKATLETTQAKLFTLLACRRRDSAMGGETRLRRNEDWEPTPPSYFL